VAREELFRFWWRSGLLRSEPEVKETKDVSFNCRLKKSVNDDELSAGRKACRNCAVVPRGFDSEVQQLPSSLSTVSAECC